MSNEYISSIAWGKNIKTASERKREQRKNKYKHLKRVGSAIGSNLKHMGKRVSRVAYKTGRSIKEEQVSKGGFYNLSGKKNIKKNKQKVKYIYIRPKRKHKFHKSKRKVNVRRDDYNQNNPFNLSI